MTAPLKPKKFLNTPVKVTTSPNLCEIKSKLTIHKQAAYESIKDKLSPQAFLALQSSQARNLIGSTLSGLLLLTAAVPSLQLPPANRLLPKTVMIASSTPKILITEDLSTMLPPIGEVVDSSAAQKLSNWASLVYGVIATANLDNQTLPNIYGLMGGEQHLLRYPGDVTEAHMRDAEDYGMYFGSGTAPLTGAWGYFASSSSKLTEDLAQKERYYVAVETFLIPNWNSDWAKLKEWYKYRKVAVINTVTKQDRVAVVGDSGPSPWTGKIFGGSPEVMEATGLGAGPRKGPVVILFVNDPTDVVPLGPLPFANISQYV
ncbi:MAG: hypothetical protein NT141_04220 [candidate division WWE3 bacterium]|nr:hypothetical protein [candidate division WWE3 bacterium]